MGGGTTGGRNSSTSQPDSWRCPRRGLGLGGDLTPTKLTAPSPSFGHEAPQFLKQLWVPCARPLPPRKAQLWPHLPATPPLLDPGASGRQRGTWAQLAALPVLCGSSCSHRHRRIHSGLGCTRLRAPQPCMGLPGSPPAGHLCSPPSLNPEAPPRPPLPVGAKVTPLGNPVHSDHCQAETGARRDGLGDAAPGR